MHKTLTVLVVALAAAAPLKSAFGACSQGYVERFDRRGNAECIAEGLARTQNLGTTQKNLRDTQQMQNDMRRLQQRLPQLKAQMRQRQQRDALLREQRLRAQQQTNR